MIVTWNGERHGVDIHTPTAEARFNDGASWVVLTDARGDQVTIFCDLPSQARAVAAAFDPTMRDITPRPSMDAFRYVPAQEPALAVAAE